MFYQCKMCGGTLEIKNAEAYWSIVLCRYGIEYVEDPATHKRIPTVNRAQYTSSNGTELTNFLRIF